VKTLPEYRKELDEIDRELVSLFQKRMALSKEIGQYKKEHSLPILDKEREQEKLDAVEAMSDDRFRPYVRRLYDEILALSKQIQK